MFKEMLSILLFSFIDIIISSKKYQIRPKTSRFRRAMYKTQSKDL